MVFIEYYISYTGANMGPNGNIQQIQRACFLFFSPQQIPLKHVSENVILETVAHV